MRKNKSKKKFFFLKYLAYLDNENDIFYLKVNAFLNNIRYNVNIDLALDKLYFESLE